MNKNIKIVFFQGVLKLRLWEKSIKFNEDPTQVEIRSSSFVDIRGRILKENNLPNDQISAEACFSSAIKYNTQPSAEDLVFPNPESFKAGLIHSRVSYWKQILSYDNEQASEILD